MRGLTWLAAIVLVPGVGRAGGTEHPDNGTVALGRAGAFTARGSDGSALAYDPAGLARQRGARVTLLSNFTDVHRCFTRAGEYGPGAGVPATTPYAAAGPMCDAAGLLESPGPMLVVSSDLGHAQGPVVALGVWGPSGPHRTRYTQGGADVDDPSLVRFEHDGRERVSWAPSRFDLVEDDLTVLYVTPAIAHEPIRGVRVGLGLQWVFAHLEFVTYGLIDRNNPRSLPSRSEVAVTDPFTPAFVAGAQVTLLPWLEAAAALRWSGPLSATGRLHLSVEEIRDGRRASLGEDAVGIAVDVDQALQVRTGLRARLPRPGRSGGDPMADEVADLEIDYVYDHTSAIDAITVRSDDPLELCDPAPGGSCLSAEPLGAVPLPHGWRDTHSVRLGGDWNVLADRLALRAGVSVESAAVPEALTLLDFAAFERLGLHAGATVRLGPVDVSVAVAHVLQPTRHVREGEGRIAGPGGLCKDPACVTNEGMHSSSIDTVSIGTTFRL